MRSSDSPRHVNNLLHTLRGEQFRHSQNVRKDRTHLSSSHTHNSPTLPVSLIWPSELESEVESSPPSTSTETGDVAKVVAGPIPKSWALKANKNEHTTQTRREALSVVLSRLSGSKYISIDVPSEGSSPPTLTLLCLRLLLSLNSGPEFAEYIVPYLPPHLRRDLLRYTAVHSPLSNSKLYALCGPEGHADGELIVVGPQATLQADHFRKTTPHCGDQGPDGANLELAPGSVETDAEEGWDSLDDERSSPHPMRTFILFSCYISTFTLLTLPPTLTNLALVNLPSSVPLHRLPGICPLLSVLDLSYNNWLVSTGTLGKGGNPLDRVGWNRWNRLRVLALRGCHISVAISENINRGRWTDVEIIR
ncbi:hypothetical protein PILCRDRAFT_774293 [Piloderma croceum F 1598]|uniref:Uncharacterized protein n=1 Tax=Piloderma croceum (strain F 1598) TaxID=765440 RepID=A0A0C3FSJ9_PILCF|nr:hypothetical protein PILCRDRAFT_774293 [Piloderma croceum F 1598]